MYVCQSQQSREDFTRVNTEGSPQDVKPLVSLKNGKARLEFAQTTSKKAFTVLEQHPMDRWDKDQLVPEWWEEKSMEKERNCSWSKTYHLISEAWWWYCHGVGMYGCQWNWFPCIYWWCDCWQKQQDEFWSVSGKIICSYSAKCFRTHWMALHSADGQWPKVF